MMICIICNCRFRYLHVNRSLGIEFPEESSFVETFVIDRDSDFGLIFGPLVLHDLDGLELGMEEAAFRRQNEPEIVAENSETDFSDFVVFVSAGKVGYLENKKR